MSKIINDDLSLNKESFTKAVKELEGLKKILTPTGRQFINFHFPKNIKPSFEDASKTIDQDEDNMFPALVLEMHADYRISHIPALYDEWFDSHSHNISRVSQCLNHQPSATRFCVLASKEIEKILGSTLTFKKNNWMPAASLELQFANYDSAASHEFTEFLTIILHVSILQG